MKNKKQIFTTILSVLVSVFMVAGFAFAVTTIGTNITTEGDLQVDNNTTLGNAASDTITLAGKTSLGTNASPVDVSAWTGSSWGIGSFLTDDMSVRTGASTYGVYGKVTATGGGADEYIKGVQGVATLATGTNIAEAFGTYGIINVNAGTVLNTYGAVGEMNVATGTTIGADNGDPNFITGVLATSYVHNGATLSNDMIDAPLIAQVQKGSAARKKATAAVVALLQGDGASNTAGAAFKAIDHSSTGGYDFDYGLDFGAGAGGPIGGQTGNAVNVFTQADIRLSSGTTIITGTTANMPVACTNVGDIYIATDGGANTVLNVCEVASAPYVGK